jgi:SAM-dependent methyltransferase
MGRRVAGTTAGLLVVLATACGTDAGRESGPEPALEGTTETPTVATEEIGPRSALFRELVKPLYRSAQLCASQAVDALLRVRTTPNARTQEGIPLDRQFDRPWDWLSVARLFRRHPLAPSDAFVDIGSGSGRTALAASRLFRCRRVIAVERDTRLHALAAQNVRNCRVPARTPVELVNADALTWELPNEANVLFFYNSFRGDPFRELVDRVLESLDRSPRRLRFVYANPLEAEFLTEISRFDLIDVVRSWRPRPDWTRTKSVHIYSVR